MSAHSADYALLGQTIAGKYQLRSILAGGSFGTVYLAQQFFCGQFVRPVAVKISRQTGLTEQTAPYLFRDALVLALLLAGPQRDGKQHLVPIHDMGLLPEHDQRGFLVMEHVEGAPLLAHIRAAGRLGVQTGLRYLKEICRALALVHAQGAVHRDLKPDNILVDPAGLVRVVDFGLASFTDPRLGFAPGSFGTFTYMAPETLLGRSTPAADVYGLGLVAYELFTGGGPHLSAPWPPPSEEDGSRHYAIKVGLKFPPPSQVHNEIRNEYRWLDALILRCLETEPARRFADAGQLLQALEICQAGGTLPALDLPPVSTEPAFLPVMPTAEPGLEESLVRQARRLLARKDYAQVIDLLDVHRPAEWAVIDRQGAQLLRLLGKAYRLQGQLRLACDCLAQLQALQREQPLLTPREYWAALTELYQCYLALGLTESAGACETELAQQAPSAR